MSARVRLRSRAMANERDEYQRLRRRAKQFIDATAAATIRTEEVIIEGQGLLFDRPEFSDSEKIRGFLRTFEEKERLLDLLDRTIAAGGVQVLVGSEANLVEAPDIGLISTSYRTNGVRMGTLAIVGPTRMDYAKLMPLVGFAAQVTSDVLDRATLEDGGVDGRGEGGTEDGAADA